MKLIDDIKVIIGDDKEDIIGGILFMLILPVLYMFIFMIGGMI